MSRPFPMTLHFTANINRSSVSCETQRRAGRRSRSAPVHSCSRVACLPGALREASLARTPGRSGERVEHGRYKHTCEILTVRSISVSTGILISRQSSQRKRKGTHMLRLSSVTLYTLLHTVERKKRNGVLFLHLIEKKCITKCCALF